MYECTEIQKDNVFTLHLCCSVDDDCLVRARISVDLWTRYDANLCEGLFVVPEEMNSVTVLPIKLFTDDTFMHAVGKCNNPAEVMLLLEKWHLI